MGAPAKLASRRAISVLPTPVGPIIRIFLGITSSRNSSGNFERRKRLRSATATALLAALWPMMYLSSSATICRGVRLSSLSLVLLFISWLFYGFDGDVVVGVNANSSGSAQRLLGDFGSR